MQFDYDKIYSTYQQDNLVWIKKTCIWKAKILSELIGDMPTDSVLEIGTGRGDALAELPFFKTKIGADVSGEALSQHQEVYKNHKLIKIDTDGQLPFNDKEIDCVVLCDILEHLEKPEELLKQAGRIGKYLLLKIPVERALLLSIMNKIHNVKYGLNHQSGHLHCWNIKDIESLLKSAGIKPIKSIFMPTPIELVKKKFGIKIAVFKICRFLDTLFNTNFFNRTLLGGSYFAIAVRD